MYPSLINLSKFKQRTVYSARFDKKDEGDQILDEIEFYINLKFNQNLTQSDIDIIHIRSQLDGQIENLGMEDRGWSFGISMTLNFYKTIELNGSSYVKIPLRSSTV